MPAPKGNRFWEARSRHGRLPIYTSAEMLWEAASDYFEWVEANPLWEDKLVTYQGGAIHEPVAKMRAMTIGGLCIFLDISQQAWSEYRNREGFGEIAKTVEQIIRQQKFSGAAADLLNANIIARDLGLVERQEHSGPGGGPIQTVTGTMSAKEAAEAYAATMGDGE